MWLLRKRPAEFMGYVDEASNGRVAGWVRDRLRPRQRLDVEVYGAGNLLGVTRAQLLREDLRGSGIGDGRYAFTFELPAGDVPAETIAAKVAGSDFWLLNSAPPPEAEHRLLNSARRGLPTLRATMSSRTADDADVEIAAELLREWRANAAEAGSSALTKLGAMWNDIVASRHGRLLDLLNGSDPRALAACMVDIHKSAASTGIAQGDRAYRDFLAATPQGRRAAVAPFHDMLASLAQYIGVERAECAEQDYVGETLAIDQEALAAKIETAIGHSLAPPNVFDGLYGLAIDGRVVHGRDIQALYAALRLIESSADIAPRIIEIGGGFGQVARYAMLGGARRYTIIDLPTVCAMQYFYLRRALPGVPVQFRNARDADEQQNGVDLIFASHVAADLRLSADIAFNCNSFPEMGDDVCRGYFSRLGEWAPLLLSINQEANREVRGPRDRQSVVGALLPDYGFTRRYRFRSWIRRGYVEELWASPRVAR